MPLEQAKARAREIITFVEDKKCDPRAAEQAARGYTFKQLFGHWLEGYAKPNLRAWQQPRDKLTKHALPFIGDMQVPHIKPSHINQLLDQLVAVKKGTQANRVRAHLSAVFKWGLSRDYGLEYNPVQMTCKPRRRELPRSTIYEHSDIRALWQAIERQSIRFSRQVGLVLLLALVTGQRKSEIVEAKASELHLGGERPFWKLPKERTKGAREHLVPLSPLAVALFNQALQVHKCSGTYIFPSQESARRNKPLAPHSVSQALARSRKLVGLSGTQSVHDLRRTVNTEMARMGISQEVRARVLNHCKKGVTDGVYNVWEYEPEMRDALNRWARELERIVRCDEFAARDARSPAPLSQHGS
jgi:integrase